MTPTPSSPGAGGPPAPIVADGAAVVRPEPAPMSPGAGSPYFISGPASISFSGGRTSAYMLHEILRAHAGQLPDNIRIVFANTGKEREETLRFVNECSARWKAKVHWIEWRDTKRGFEEVTFDTASRDGEPFKALIAKKRITPNWQMRFCTQYLKVQAMTDFLVSVGFTPGGYSEVVGLRYDEGHRILKMLARNEARDRLCIAPLSKAKVTERDVMAFWGAQPFDLGLEPGEGNCDLCFLKGRNLRKELIRRRPASADWWIVQEKSVNGFFDRRDSYAGLQSEVQKSPDFFTDDNTEHDVECGLLCEPVQESNSAAFQGVSPLEPAPSGAPAGGAGATRPVLRWHGGKWKLAPWIISYFPRHLVYVEPFGGAASVLLRKQQAPTEVYNDLDTEVVNLFRVLRSADAKKLIGALRLTPFARAEFDLAFEVAIDPVERARRLVVRSFFAGGSRGVLDVDRAKAGFNGGSARSRGDKPQRSHASDWSNYADALPAIIDRMMAVVIENRPAVDLIKQHDGGGTLFYVDPPYLADVRSDRARNTYRHELTDTEHRDLLQFLEHLHGMVVLSGYPHPLYDKLLSDWRRVERTAMADGARPRTEVLWINPACAAALDRESQDFHAIMEGAAE